MYINPKYAIEQGWIKFPEWADEAFVESCIQPNAIDITLDRVFESRLTDHFVLTENTKKMRTAIETYPTYERDGETNLFQINNGCVDIMSDFHVTIPAGIAAYIIVRSTLNRNGLFITSGLYDQGYDNYVGFALRNNGPAAFIAPHTRVGQLVFVKSEDSGKMYDGIYNTNVGEHWTEINTETDSTVDPTINTIVDPEIVKVDISNPTVDTIVDPEIMKVDISNPTEETVNKTKVKK